MQRIQCLTFGPLQTLTKPDKYLWGCQSLAIGRGEFELEIDRRWRNIYKDIREMMIHVGAHCSFFSSSAFVGQELIIEDISVQRLTYLMPR